MLTADPLAGRGKPGFLTRIGFSADAPAALIAALRAHVRQHEVVGTVETEYGVKYRVDGLLSTPDGRPLRVRTIWQIDHGADVPRFITIRPLKERERTGQ